MIGTIGMRIAEIGVNVTKNYLVPKFAECLENKINSFIEADKRISSTVHVPKEIGCDRITFKEAESNFKNCSDATVKISNFTEDIERIASRNEELEGESHPETGIKFEAKIVENDEGNLVEIVAPEFDSKFDAQLPEDLYEASDRTQFKECNKQLSEAIDKDYELENTFSSEQLEQIADGKTPNGYTWHHDVEKGKVQLVDSDIHAKTGHTGGKSVWGGGSENR